MRARMAVKVRKQPMGVRALRAIADGSRKFANGVGKLTADSAERESTAEHN